MDITRDENDFENLKEMFLEANRAFLENHVVLIRRKISERCLCGALMCELNKQLEKMLVTTIMLILNSIGHLKILLIMLSIYLMKKVPLSVFFQIL